MPTCYSRTKLNFELSTRNLHDKLTYKAHKGLTDSSQLKVPEKAPLPSFEDI